MSSLRCSNLRSIIMMVAILLSLLNLTQHVYMLQDEENCFLTQTYDIPQQTGVTIVFSLSPLRVRSCFSKIPYDSEVARTTINHAKKTLDAYSFEHIVKNSAVSGSSYSISVDARRKLDEFGSFSSDYAFHRELSNLFSSFRDAHTVYMMPEPYRFTTVILPFLFTAKWVDSENPLVIIDPETTDGVYNSITGHSTAPYSGMVVTKINNVDALTYLTHFSNQFYISKDYSPRLNRILKSRVFTLAEIELPTSDEMSITFESNVTVNLPYLLLFDSVKKGVADFKEQTLKKQLPQSTKTLEHILAIDPLKLYSPKQKINELFDKSHLKTRKPTESSLVYYSEDQSVLYYHFPDKKIAMFTITTFLPSAIDKKIAPWTYFQKVFELGIEHSKKNGVDKVILNVQENGGGFVCLAMSLLNYLIPSFSNKNLIDERREFKSDPFISQLLIPELYLDYTTKKPITDMTYFTKNTVTRKFGGVSKQYTSPFSINCPSSFWFPKPASHFYSKIIVLTDGLCGSACSQFISKLKTYNKAKIVNIGGGAGGSSTFETSAFCGGAVMNTENFASMPELLTNAEFTVNVHHLYVGHPSTLPREFLKSSGDVLLKTFEFSNENLLFEKIDPIFEAMESNNLIETTSRGFIYSIELVVLASVAGIGWILVVILFVSCCVLCLRRKTSTPSVTDYIEFKTSPNM